MQLNIVGNVPKPTGPFRILYGAEYASARSLANKTNESLKPGTFPRGQDVHEIHTVKFGGSPTTLSNKVSLNRKIHSQCTNWWNKLQKDIENK